MNDNLKSPWWYIFEILENSDIPPDRVRYRIRLGFSKIEINGEKIDIQFVFPFFSEAIVPIDRLQESVEYDQRFLVAHLQESLLRGYWEEYNGEERLKIKFDGLIKSERPHFKYMGEISIYPAHGKIIVGVNDINN